MILITMHHYAYHGGFEFWYYVPFNRVLVQFLALGGKLGVNAFVLISGYFLSANTGGIRWKNVIKFVFQVTFFSVAIQAAGWITGLSRFSLESLLRAVFPLLYREWWFANVYFILLLLSPFLNQFLAASSQKLHFQCIAVMLCIWSLVPTVLGTYTEGNDLTWFVTLYILAAYIRKYNTSFFTNQKRQILLLGISTILLCLSVLIIDLVGYRQKQPLSMDDIMYLAQMNSPLLTLQSVSLFCVFHNLSIKPSKIINTIATSMFGVYLIHDSNLLRPYLWHTLFENKLYQYSPYLFLHATVSILLVFAVCTALSMLYDLTLGKWVQRLYPAKKADNRKLKISIYLLIQWTWGLLQTLLGCIVFLLNIQNKHFWYHGALVTLWKAKSSVSLGMFVFITDAPYFYEKLKDIYSQKELTQRLLVHEYGHTIQSLILGPFYLIIMGIPSTLWGFLPAFNRKRKEKQISYFSFFTEKWANQLGEAVTKCKSMEQLIID